jgi:hypothetical protein
LHLFTTPPQEQLGRSDLAIPALRLAAGQGSPKALVTLGNFAYWGTGIEANATYALQLFAAAGRSDSAHGAFNCGMMCVTSLLFWCFLLSFCHAAAGTFWAMVLLLITMKPVFGLSLYVFPLYALTYSFAGSKKLASLTAMQSCRAFWHCASPFLICVAENFDVSFTLIGN